MIKFTIFSYKITIEKRDEKQKRASEAKRKVVLQKIEKALQKMKDDDVKYSEYKLQKYANVSINTIKKYRDEIAYLI